MFHNRLSLFEYQIFMKYFYVDSSTEEFLNQALSGSSLTGILKIFHKELGLDWMDYYLIFLFLTRYKNSSFFIY